MKYRHAYFGPQVMCRNCGNEQLIPFRNKYMDKSHTGLRCNVCSQEWAEIGVIEAMDTSQHVDKIIEALKYRVDNFKLK